MYRPILLVVLDGWGLSNTTSGNPIREAELPTIKKLNSFYPLTALQASGISVGLPWNVAGNSEVGHMTLGAGRVIYQNLPRIALSIQDGSFAQNPAILTAIERAKEKNGRFHVMGLLSSGGVHSSKEHLLAVLNLAKTAGIGDRTFVHVFTDGRDSSPTDGVQQIRELERKMGLLGVGKIASVIGRNWAMDRNNNWDRTEKAYRLLTEGKGTAITDIALYLEQSYAEKTTDEFMEAGVVTEDGKPVATVEEGDSVFFFNFREDRARQLTKSFTLPGFPHFERPKFLDIHFVTMTEYERDLPVSGIAFPPEKIENDLGSVLAGLGKKQLRVAETEKYAHVTYFFNGGKEHAYPEEDRILIPSPVVSRFDEAPAMSAKGITDTLLKALREKKYDFILANYANPDMVAHTGNEEATIEAVEDIDKNLAILVPEVLRAGGAMFITADHGNAEELKKATTGEVDTEHSTNPVPFWFVAPDNHREKTPGESEREQNEVRGLLSDVAPTVLDLMGIPQPDEMNGTSLLPILK